MTARPFVVATGLVLVLGTGIGCANESADAGDTPWITQVDSSGDTIRIRITGEVPERLVRNVVTEVTVGAEDGAEEETFGAIVSILPTDDGGMLVHDDQAMTLRAFDSTGAYLREVGRKGGGPGEFEHINGLTALPDGRIVVWDAGGGRLNLYSPSGEFRTSWRLPVVGIFFRNSLWSDDAGRIAIWAILEQDSTDFTRAVRGVIRLTDSGSIVDSLRFPSWGGSEPSLIAMTKDKRMSTSMPLPYWPRSVAKPSPRGGLVSGPGAPYHVYLTDRVGRRPVRIERDRAPVPVSSTERAEQRHFIETNLRQVDPSWSWTEADIPAMKPAYDEILVGLDGRIWVQLSTPGEPIPTAELPKIAPGRESEPRFTTRESALYDVYSSEGELLGRVSLPRRTSILATRGNRIFAEQRDSLDVPHAVRLRIEPGLPP